jgi:capsid protein
MSTVQSQAPILYDQYGKPIRSRSNANDERIRLQRIIQKKIRASYDASKSTDYNQAYWANADGKSPDAANSAQVRKRLRARSRYEVIENNPYLKGALLTMANDFVGSGPTLKVTDARLTKAEKDQIQLLYLDWFKEVKLRQKYWQLRVDRVTSGEGCGLHVNRLANESESKLFIRPFECDHIASPWQTSKDKINYDGVAVDQDTDEPIEYFIYKDHPGTDIFSIQINEGEWIPANRVVHWFRKDRCWHRAIPEITPSLPLCALLRRYTLATVLAAETAASITAVVETMASANTTAVNWWQGGNDSTPSLEKEELELFPVEIGSMMQIPTGTKVSQLKPEQPTAVYDKFVDALLREIFRPILVPFNIGSGYSGAFNMASGALDIQLYRTGIQADRMSCDEDVSTPTFVAWWKEISLTPAISATIKQKLKGKPPRHSWGWDSVRDEHTDPFKVANALSTKLEAGIISDEDVQQSMFNRTAEEHYTNLERQQTARKKLGMPINGKSTSETPSESDPNADSSQTDDDEEIDDEETDSNDQESND